MGCAWISVVPFRTAGVMRRPLPDLPFISTFPELNLRLYVERDGKPGVWFLSLDATNRLAVWAARHFFHLPYAHATVSLSESSEAIDYVSTRRSAVARVEFRARYGPTSSPYEAAPGTLEHWLTERYWRYAQSPRGEIYRADLHHHPWPLQNAHAEIERNDLLVPHGLTVEGSPALLHFARRIDVVVWSPVALASA